MRLEVEVDLFVDANHLDFLKEIYGSALPL
jgi:hypothetical protein